MKTGSGYEEPGQSSIRAIGKNATMRSRIGHESVNHTAPRRPAGLQRAHRGGAEMDLDKRWVYTDRQGDR